MRKGIYSSNNETALLKANGPFTVRNTGNLRSGQLLPQITNAGTGAVIGQGEVHGVTLPAGHVVDAGKDLQFPE